MVVFLCLGGGLGRFSGHAPGCPHAAYVGLSKVGLSDIASGYGEGDGGKTRTITGQNHFFQFYAWRWGGDRARGEENRSSAGLDPSAGRWRRLYAPTYSRNDRTLERVLQTAE